MLSIRGWTRGVCTTRCTAGRDAWISDRKNWRKSVCRTSSIRIWHPECEMNSNRSLSWRIAAIQSSASHLITFVLFTQIYEFLAYKFPARIDPVVHQQISKANEFKSAVICQVTHSSASSITCNQLNVLTQYDRQIWPSNYRYVLHLTSFSPSLSLILHCSTR